jgi:predicted ArsR family transcriptional regulator
MDPPDRPDDVLSQGTRARLFGLLGETRRPMGTEELARRLDLHPNGVRMHLERLREAGLITRERTRQARGRPRDMWLISPDARPGGDPPTAYADLGRWLARVISPGRTSLRRIEATGRLIGRELAPEGPCAPEEKMHAALASMGFQPRREPDRAGLTYRLCNCPYREAVQENAEVVCTLHRGMTRGLLDAISPETELEGFVAREPYAAGCLIQLGGGLAAETGGLPA